MSWLLLFLAWGPFPAFGESDNPYCEEPDFTMASPPSVPTTDWREMNLLNEEEKADPEAGRILAFSPGPYGHSELGFRYLARLLGYQGSFKDKESVEIWLEEIENDRMRMELKTLWEKWVVRPTKRLPVPRGAISRLPPEPNPVVFFKNEADRKKHARCIRNDLGTALCKSQQNEEIRKGDLVYFSKAEFGRPVLQYCKVSYARRAIETMVPEDETYSETRTFNHTTRDGSGTVTTRTRNWKRNKEKPEPAREPAGETRPSAPAK